MSRSLQHPVPEKLLARIGDMTVSFALLEMEIQLLVASLLQDGQRIGQIVTAELAFRNLRALAISLYKERRGEDTDFGKLKELMTHAARVEETRNQITHSVWATGGGADTVTRVKTTAKEKRGLRFAFDRVSEDDLTTLVADIKKLARDVQDFWIHLIRGDKAPNDHAARECS